VIAGQARLTTGKQLGFSGYGLATAQKRSKRETFPAEYGAVVPWQKLIDLIEPHDRKASQEGRGPTSAATGDDAARSPAAAVV